MNNNEEKNSIKNEILKEIKKGDIKMHPKIYFVLKSALLIVVAVLLFILIAYLTSYSIFYLENNGARFLLRSGLGGLVDIFHAVPLILIFLLLLLFYLIEKTIKKFNFAYKRPLIYSFLFVVIIAVGFGFFLHKNPLQKTLSCGLPQNHNLNAPNTFKGEIIEINENEIKIQDINGEIIYTIMPSESFKMEERELERGDRIIFRGKRDDKKIINISSFQKLNCGCEGCDPDDFRKFKP